MDRKISDSSNQPEMFHLNETFSSFYYKISIAITLIMFINKFCASNKFSFFKRFFPNILLFFEILRNFETLEMIVVGVKNADENVLNQFHDIFHTFQLTLWNKRDVKKSRKDFSVAH